MTNDKLNQYIKHYIEKDKTGRAIMLTGSWGIGKSYYIKNELIPFLTENGEHQCIVVSLYGLSSISDVSKAIYWETRVKKLKFESEAGKATLLVAKTLLKGLAGQIGLDLNADEKDLQALYQSVDLSNKLIIIEDVERTKIDIIELLGYVNSLCEQDAVKVLLVTNEKEIIQYKPTEDKEPKKAATSDWFAEMTQTPKEGEKKEYTEKTQRYLETKEKTISDTIRFTGNLKIAIQEIIGSFDNKSLKQFATDEDTSNIVDIMYLMKSENLRSVIFACQKTSDIFDQISDELFSEDFYRTILYGIVAFSQRLHAGADNTWIGLEHYSQELGLRNYPLFRFCYDFILTQQFDISLVPAAASSLEKLRLYDSNKSSADPDLQNLYNYYLLTEEDVYKVVDRITLRLKDPADISFHDYAKIAVILIGIKHSIGVEIDDAKELLVNNLQGRGDELSADDLFWYIMGSESQEEQEEFISLRQRMIDTLNEKKSFIPEFDYLPNQSASLYEYVIHNTGAIYDTHGFAKNLDIVKLVGMFENSTAAQMDSIRGSFNAVYRPVNIREILSEDLSAIDELLNGIIEARESAVADKVQHLQYKWFISCLSEIKSKLSAQ